MSTVITNDAPITEAWLAEVGFKWHQLDRQPSKHWLLWVGGMARYGSTEDLGIELAHNSYQDDWFCWIRSDFSGRYHRFLHIRHLRMQGEVARLFEGLTGHPWTPENHLYGSAHPPERAAQFRENAKRLDMQLRRDVPWHDVERDDTRGGALPEHLQAYADARETSR